MGVRPGDWSPLTLSGDPTPGDPDVLLRVASYMDVMAGHAKTADDGLAAVLRQSGDGAFVGKTADWLREQISKEMSGFIAGVRTAFSAAGPAVRTYAEALREAQAKADQALRDAAGAGDDEERINALKTTAENAAADVKTAAGTARQAILDATGHIKSPVTPKSACEVFWEIFTWLTLIVTVVAIFVGGPLGLIAFAMNAALAVKATLDFAMGKTNALGLALGLLGLLGPSTRPLIALGDLTKLATTAWRNITQFSRNSFTLARAGINDFWRTVSTLSLSGAMRGIGDIGVTLANSVKVGALMIPRIVGPMDGLAARGFVTLEKFTLVTVPATVVRLGTVGQLGLVKLAGVTADAGRFIAANAVRFGNLMARELGGWQWLRIFLPLAGHEIRAVGVSGAFKLGVLGRGLGLTRFDGLAALGGGVRLANGLTTVHVVKPGGAPPPAGGINFSPSGLHLPDLIEKPLIGAPSAQQLSFSARGLDLSAARGALGLHDLAGLRGVQNLDVPMPRTAGPVTPIPATNLPGAAHTVDLGHISRLEVPTVGPVAGMNQVIMPTVATPGAVTLPNMQIGNLSATLNRGVGGVDGLADFGRAELRNLHMGEVSAVRVSETGVAFNLGAPEKAFGDVSLASPTPTPVSALTPTPTGSISPTAPTGITRVDAPAPIGMQLGRTADATTVHQALNLLDEPGTAALTGLHRLDPPTVTVPTSLSRDLSMPAPPRLDLAGGPSPQQLNHLHAVEQLKQAQHALANVSGDALALARAEKDVRVAEALVRRTADGVKVEAREVSNTVDNPAANRTGTVAPDLAAARPAADVDLAAAKPAMTVDESVQALQTRLDNLRGPDAPRTDFAALDLEHRFAQLRPTASADLAELPAVPTHRPGTSMAELESRLAALRGTDPPSPAARQLELEHRFNQLRPGGAVEHRQVDPAMFPDVPTISPAEATARATAVERLTDLEAQLVAVRAEETPLDVGPTRLDDAGSAATPQSGTGRPQTPDQTGTPGRAEGPTGTGKDDGLLNLPSVPRTDPAATPGAEALSQRLTELVSDARGVDLPGSELRVLSTEVRTAIEQGRHGDAARGLNTLHDRIDRQALFQRLDSYRVHVDAGHHRAAQLGMDKSTWLQHAIDIERATAAGRTYELHRLLNDYENSLAGKLAEQKLHDQVVPDGAPGRAPDEAGSTGDLDELQARLDALRGDHTPDPRLAELELELRFANLRGSDGPDVALPAFPEPPTAPPTLPSGGLDDLQKRLDALRGDSTPDPNLAGLELRHRLDALRGVGPDTPPVRIEELPDVPTVPPGALDDLTDRLADLRAHREEVLGMPPAERAEWSAEFARSGDEAADAAVLARYETRIAALEREARLAQLRDGTGPLSADEYRTWQDALVRAGDNQADIDQVLSRYAARLDEHRLDSTTQINVALTSPDHLRPLDSRLDEALGGLSQGLRNDTAARYTTLGDRLAQLRGADATAVSGRAADELPSPGPQAADSTIGHRLDELPSPPRDLPTTRPDPNAADAATGTKLTETPAITPSAETPAVTKSAESPTATKPQDAPARPTPTAGDEVLELPAPRRVADDASATQAEKLVTPPRDLLGDGRPTGPARVIEVDAERWTPFKDAFRIEPTTPGQPPKVTRPPASGERVGVGYRLTVTEQDMHVALKLHLDAAPGVTAREIAEVKARTVEGLQRYVNAPQQHLPGWDVPMRVTVDFVDDPADARGTITVAPAGTQMSQQTWAAGASPAKYAHEIVHQLGVKDSTAPPNALLRDTHQPEHGDLMGSHPHGVDDFVLTPRALSQIAAVLSPYFSGSTAARPAPDPLTGHLAEEFWASGVDIPPPVTEEAVAPAPARTVSTPSGLAPAPLAAVVTSSTTPRITVTAPDESIEMTVLAPITMVDSPLPGLYKTRPDLLYTSETIDDLDGLIRGLEQSVADAVRARVAEKLPLVPGLSKLSVQTDEIGQALRDDGKSFFTTGGRSFDVRDGLFGWHRVTVVPTWSPAEAKVIDQSEDKAKFDTRSDQSAGTKHGSTSGGSGSVGAGTMFPQRVGYGAGGSVDVALSRPLESFEDGVKLTDSHNVRSGSASHLVAAPVGFSVVVTDPARPLTGPKAADRHVGEPVRADVTFRSVDDIAKATPREPDWLTVDPSKHTSMLVENFTPVRILRADIGLAEGADPTGTWNDVVEDLLVLLQPTKAVGPGTLGSGQARGLFKESAVLGNLMPALDTVVHPPTITSTHGAHALSLELTASVPKLSVLADVAKTSFRWQPGQSEATKVAHSSRVGMGLSLVPARWAFGPGYVQARLFGGFIRSMTASASQGGTSRTGTEFKDIANVLVEAHFRVTVNAGLREVPGSRLFGEGTVAPVTVDLVVLGHLPAVRVAQLLNDNSVLVPSPTQWYVPPYALSGGGRSVIYGLSGFQQLYLDVNGLIRRIEGGFLPEFGTSGKVKRMATSRAAIERQANQDALDRALSMPGLRQGKGALFKTGLIASLSRTKKIGTRHVIVHVTASYTRAFQHLGTSKGDAVRTTHTDAFQGKISAGSQWRGAVAFEGGGVFRLTGSTAGAFVPGGAVEVRGRFDRRSGAQLGGQESRLNGGTPDSQAFGNDLQITVQVYAYTKRLGPDPKSRVRFGRVMHQRLPRPATDSGRVVNPTHEPAALVAGKKFTRFRLVETRPVTVQFDNASVLAQPVSLPTTLTPRPDPLAVDRRTQLKLDELRDWVDAGPKSTVNRWLSVEDFPGSTFITALARDALHAAQQYTDAVSRTKLGGLRGTDGLAEGMPVWANMIDRLGESRQSHGLAVMLDGVWHVDKVTSAEEGAATDLAIAAVLTNPKVLPAYATITNESASVGSVEISADKTVEKQFAMRANFSANVRRVGTSTSTTHGGGAVFPATYEKVLYAGSKRDTESISGAIERNANNRKGKQRSFLVAFDMRVSAAVEITNDPDRYAVIPQSLRSGEWLHHHKSVARHGTIANAIFLRLSAATMVKLGLLPKLAGDPGMISQPWLPTMPPTLTMLPGRSIGLGLYTFDGTPTLTESMTTVLRTEAAKLGPDRGMVKSLLDMVQGRITNRSIGKISDSLSGPGLHDPMLNRRRLLYLFTADGQAQHWSAMTDGGVSVLHMKPGRMTQRSWDVRLIAEPVGEPTVLGFVADHDDLDIKTTHTSEQGVTRQRMHGSTSTIGVAGTGVSNHQGENLAVGLGDTVGQVSQVLNAQSDGSTTIDTNLSSGRGIKAKLEIPTRYTLAVFDNGERVDGDLLVIHDKVVQDRWADDLRPPRSTPAGTPVPYEVVAPEKPAPGWRTHNGMPLPPRFSAEDLNPVAQVQRLVADLLADAAKRLKTTGYAGAHQIHQSLTPEILLPGLPKLMTEAGLDLPPAVSAQIFGQKAAINIKLLPESASLGGVSSGVYREHAPQRSGGYSAGTSVITQNLRIPRIPLIGRGFADDPYQALEAGGPGVAAGDTQAADESGGNATSDLGNVKPESRSASVDYLSRVEITVSLSYSLAPAKTVTSSSQPDELVNVSLRMGLHDARTALHIPKDGTAQAKDSPGRIAAFDEIVDHEAKLAKAAENFVSAADKLDQARYDAYTAPEGSPARVAAEATLPGLHEDWDRAGNAWWELLQRHHQLLDDFRHRYVGVPKGTSGTDAAALAKHIHTNSGPQPTGTATHQLSTGTTTHPPATGITGRPTDGPQVLPTPGGGYCQLYSTVGSAPELVSAQLAAAGLGSPALHAWLGDPAAVRAQVTAWAAHGGGLVPSTSQLGQAAELLRRLVERYLQTVGPDGVPAAALEGYRNNRVLQLRTEVDAMNRDTLLGRLRDAGITSLCDPGLPPATQMRDLYLGQRTADLVAAGWDPAEARAHAEGQVPLKPTTDGSPPRNLADEALSMRAMFDYLTASGHPVGLQALTDGTLRDQLVTHLLSPLRPADASEFAALSEAVRHWEVHWQDPVGEAFAGLLAAALDARIRIHAPGHTQTLGRDSAPLVDVYRRSDHYQAMVRQQPAPVESAPPGKQPAGKQPAVELDQLSGPAVEPKGAKPFEVDPPGPAGGQSISGDTLRNQQVRVNPAWMPLSDFTPEIYAGRPDAHWHYVVTESDDIMIGSEEILTVVSAKQLDDLHAAMRTKHPDLTLDQLRNSINQQGHPTIGVRFDNEGRAYVGKGRISGELRRDPATGRWIVDDKSGRYMSEKIRPGLDPADVKRWLDGVATRLSEQMGVPVEARPYKHTTTAPKVTQATAPPPAPPEQATAPPAQVTDPPTAVPTTVARTTDAAPPVDDLRMRWVEFKAQRMQAEGTDPVASTILANGLTADRETMLADLATEHAHPHEHTAPPPSATEAAPPGPAGTVSQSIPPATLDSSLVPTSDRTDGRASSAPVTGDKEVPSRAAVEPPAVADEARETVGTAPDPEPTAIASGQQPAAGTQVGQEALPPARQTGTTEAVRDAEPATDGGRVLHPVPSTAPDAVVVPPGGSELADVPDLAHPSTGGGSAPSQPGGDRADDTTPTVTQDSAQTGPANQQGAGSEPTLRLRGGGSGGSLPTLMSLFSGARARSGMFTAPDAAHFYEEAKRIGWNAAGDDRVAQALHRLGRQTGLRSAQDKAREFVWHVVTTGTPVQPDIVIDDSHLFEAEVHGQTIQVRASVEEDPAGRVVRVVRAQPPLPLDTHVAALVQAGWTVVTGDGGTTIDPDAQLVHVDPADAQVHSALHDIQQIATDSLGATHLAYTNRVLGAEALLAEVPTLVEQDNRRLVDNEMGSVMDAWRRLDRRMSWLLHTPRPRGYERLVQMPAGHHANASFERWRWQLRLRYDLDADRSRDVLVHEKFHSTQEATVARWRVAETGDPGVLAGLIKDPEVQRELLEGPESQLDASQREVAELLSRHGLNHPDRAAIYQLLAERSDLMAQMRRWSAAAADSAAGERLRERVQRAASQVGTLECTVWALYLSLLHEAQAFLLGLWIQEAGSVHRWGAAAAQLPPTDGYDSIPLGTPDKYPHMPAGAAGVFLRPSSSTTQAPTRLPRREGMLLVVQVTDAAQADRVLRRLRDDLPAGTMVELLTAAPISALRAVELAQVLGGDRVLALDVDLVEPTGAVADHFVARSRDHRPSLGPGARYYTVHTEPQQSVLDFEMVAVHRVGPGRHQLMPGWHVQTVGQRVWIGPADESPAVLDDDPPVVIGLPSRQTPWPVWVLGTWIGRALASHVGATTESGFVRVHRPEPRPVVLPEATGDLLHPVSDVERRTVAVAFGSAAVVDEVGHLPAATGGPDLGFTGHDLVAGLLDVAGAAAAEQNPSVLVAALDGLAARLAAVAPATGAVGEQAARHNLLAAGYLVARAHGVFELTPQRLAAAYRVLAAYHDDGRFLAGETALEQLLRSVNSDWYGDVDPTRLQRLLELNQNGGLDKDDLEDLIERDDMWLSIWLRDLQPIDHAAGVWSMGGTGLSPVPPAAEGELVVVYRAGPDLLPLPPAGSPAHTWVPTGPALLAQLGGMLGRYLGEGAWIRLVPVVDEPVDPDLAGRLAEGLAALHRRRADRITLGAPVEPSVDIRKA
ncbi:hypothetical protein O7608_02640 [Solwaraspora sp. WMMA2056]|uniref:hypothetical protein n=1 Tax=Solwaraspora sp. WMMA2056 TaxID=3015161 RepID=UPI00259B9981|nr:hypothetical protein [Solwaraspora sp. WMMA2056]WJK41352.1 hypothetical protein O7608_02640 [Solwaraspora sp. WMMA2056]